MDNKAPLVKFVRTCCPHQAEEYDEDFVDTLMRAISEKNVKELFSTLMHEFVPMGDVALRAALMYEGIVMAMDVPEFIEDDPVQTCKNFLQYALNTLESLYTQMDMTPRAMMLNWALKGAVHGKSRSYGNENSRYWNPVEAVEHDFSYEAYLEERHGVTDESTEPMELEEPKPKKPEEPKPKKPEEPEKVEAGGEAKLVDVKAKNKVKRVKQGEEAPKRSKKAKIV